MPTVFKGSTATGDGGGGGGGDGGALVMSAGYSSGVVRALLVTAAGLRSPLRTLRHVDCGSTHGVLWDTCALWYWSSRAVYRYSASRACLAVHRRPITARPTRQRRSVSARTSPRPRGTAA